MFWAGNRACAGAACCHLCRQAGLQSHAHSLPPFLREVGRLERSHVLDFRTLRPLRRQALRPPAGQLSMLLLGRGNDTVEGVCFCGDALPLLAQSGPVSALLVVPVERGHRLLPVKGSLGAKWRREMSVLAR